MNPRGEEAAHPPPVPSSEMPSASITRPTEAQLKWALLHHRRVALAVQSYIRRLYLYPESLQDVPGLSQEEEEEMHSLDDEPCAGEISQGRRTLLRISQRAYEQRKHQIVHHGFRYHRSCSDVESDDSSYRSCDPVASTDRHGAVYSPNQTSSHAQNAVPTTVRRKRFRQRRRKFQPRCSDPERVRRFKEAFQAALQALEVAARHDRPESPDPALSSSARIWTRPDVSTRRFHDDAYAVWGSSKVPKRPPSVHNPTLTPGKAPLDRGATWLQLLQVGSKSNTPCRDSLLQLRTPGTSTGCPNKGDDSRSLLSPALRQQVADVAREIFSGERHASSQKDPSKNESTPPLPASLETLERDVSSFVEQFEQHIASAMADTVVASDVMGVDSALSSPRHSDFGILNTFLSPQADGIAPVVTYDSDDDDDSVSNMLDESAITRNPYETFTIQVLDSSFSCWNDAATESAAIDETEGDASRSALDFDTDRHDKIDDGRRDTSIPRSNHAVLFQGEILDMSPVNFKRILALLPSDDPELVVVPAPSHGTPALYETIMVGDDHPLEGTSSMIKMGVKEETDFPTEHSSDPTASWMKDHSSSLRGVVPSHPSIRKRPVVRDMTPGLFSFPPCIPASSAGCGLYSERASHYNVHWEKQWML